MMQSQICSIELNGVWHTTGKSVVASKGQHSICTEGARSARADTDTSTPLKKAATETSGGQNHYGW